jgi:hypothetical protein
MLNTYLTLFWVKTSPGTISVSSMVPPNFFETLMSLRSTSPFKVAPEFTNCKTESTAIGAKIWEY